MKTLVVVTCLMLLIAVDASSNKIKESEDGYCQKSTPCAWEVYNKFDREKIEYYIPSPCECPKGFKCKRSEDDISLSAYVFRCVKE